MKLFVYVSGFSGLCQGGVGMLSDVVRECSCSKWDWSVVIMVCGSVVISLVAGTHIVCRLGWSLALGCRPTEVLKFWWHRLALFLYSSFSIRCRVSTSFFVNFAGDCRDSFIT